HVVLILPHPPGPPPFPYTTLFRSQWRRAGAVAQHESCRLGAVAARQSRRFGTSSLGNLYIPMRGAPAQAHPQGAVHHSLACLARSEEHTSELQSLTNLVCRLLLDK